MIGRNITEERAEKIRKVREMDPDILSAIRQNLGYKPNFEPIDGQICMMSKREMFERFMTWNGIIGYEDKIINAIEDIYGVCLED